MDLIKIRTDEIHNDIASALKLRGDALLAQGEYERANKDYRHSLRHERGAAIAMNRGQTMHQIGNCESHLGNHEMAAACYLEALSRFHVVGMREFLSTAAGELGFALLECDPPALQGLSDEQIAAVLQDLTAILAEAIDVPGGITPQRCVGIARKTFGTMTLCILSGRAATAGDWAFHVVTELLGPMLAAIPAGEEGRDRRYSGQMLQTPLEVAFLVADLEDSRDANGDPDEGLLRDLMELCCSIDGWTRGVLRLPHWLATYLTRRHCVINVTGERLTEFMTNCDNDIEDDLELVRGGR
jgi:hypothetical protein